ncbi:hypothetical protein BST33_00075 [Mycolicibacter minnesotensis]|uniref:Uncharacterized protein n=1 Tax=Mycolicibacter minnesotensis TaxID=1118379 RepID=A0A7I7R928_9MYCO|nr:hypothetical protein [Mycolicibacter minnesotensis]ORB04342.1 hypothetical protein BST33_00075 [Mycolicibacter minnesotensis]BBY34912.1 hypothetical protein MMIN_29730 [Mycolicibacter minnesotensis]
MSSLLEWAGVAAGSGVLGSLITKVFDWKLKTKEASAAIPRLDAEAAQIVANTAVSLMAPLQHQVAELQSRVEALETEYEASQSRLGLALKHIRSLYSWIYTHAPDHTPPAPPKELELNY